MWKHKPFLKYFVWSRDQTIRAIELIFNRPQLFDTSFSVICPSRAFCTNNSSSKSIILPCHEKLKNYGILQSFKECLFFVLCLFCFLLLSNKPLHVIIYTYIGYWNTFQYKYMIQITFHVVKQCDAPVTSEDICLLYIILFLCLFPFCLDFALFH